MKEKLSKVIEENISKKERKKLRIVKKILKEWMKKKKIEKRGVKKLLEIMRKIGGWKVMEGEEWKEGKLEWSK